MQQPWSAFWTIFFCHQFIRWHFSSMVQLSNTQLNIQIYLQRLMSCNTRSSKIGRGARGIFNCYNYLVLWAPGVIESTSKLLYQRYYNCYNSLVITAPGFIESTSKLLHQRYYNCHNCLFITAPGCLNEWIKTFIPEVITNVYCLVIGAPGFIDDDQNFGSHRCARKSFHTRGVTSITQWKPCNKNATNTITKKCYKIMEPIPKFET